MKQVLLSAVLCITLLAGCKKSDSEPNPIVGKWTVVNTVEWYTPTGSGRIEKDTVPYGAGSYVDFQSNGNVVGSTGSGRYSVSGNSLTVTVNGITSTSAIQNMDAHNLTLYEFASDASGLDQLWTNLQK
ncbi:hypothetical protein [Parasediminibacterium sp. JCM 36343]|uniref:hypothetical protein n=1 Tax=Parasediminibacterium sp. JCM 36343 TaxID=3374279 RepID=UPI00397E6982